MYINGNQVRSFVIPEDTPSGQCNWIRNLKGASEINNIRFTDGSDFVGYKYNINGPHVWGSRCGITPKGFERIVFEKNPEARNYIEILHFNSANDFLQSKFLYSCDQIMTSIEDYESECIVAIKAGTAGE